MLVVYLINFPKAVKWGENKKNTQRMTIRFCKAILYVLLKQQMRIGEGLVLYFLYAGYLIIIYAPKFMQFRWCTGDVCCHLVKSIWVIES